MSWSPRSSFCQGMLLPGEFAPTCDSQPQSSDPTTLGGALPSPTRSLSLPAGWAALPVPPCCHTPAMLGKRALIAFCFSASPIIKSLLHP